MNEEQIDAAIKELVQGPTYVQLPASGLKSTDRQVDYKESIRFRDN